MNLAKKEAITNDIPRPQYQLDFLGFLPALFSVGGILLLSCLLVVFLLGSLDSRSSNYAVCFCQERRV